MAHFLPMILLLTTLLAAHHARIIPQSEVNVWATLATPTGQDHIRLSKTSAAATTEDIKEAIKKMRDLVSEIKEETSDWSIDLFKNLGLSGWSGSILKTCLFILFVITFALVVICSIRKMIRKFMSGATSPPKPAVNRVSMATVPEEIELENLEKSWEDESLSEEQWSSVQSGFRDSFSESEQQPPPCQAWHLQFHFVEACLPSFLHRVLTCTTATLGACVCRGSTTQAKEKTQYPECDQVQVSLGAISTFVKRTRCKDGKAEPRN
ncbi:uncharacterized protein LOC134551796 [Prinia subflava]|uniref:uncharacterized protein LOC134551796 n=1 Tax=Prinia subflava TaxID=208062 RepID=UPI002FDFE8DC